MAMIHIASKSRNCNKHKTSEYIYSTLKIHYCSKLLNSQQRKAVKWRAKCGICV